MPNAALSAIKARSIGFEYRRLLSNEL